MLQGQHAPCLKVGRIRVPYPFQWEAPTFDGGEAFAMMAASFVALVGMISLYGVGVGMAMEGIEQIPVGYDLMSKMTCQHDKHDVKCGLIYIQGDVMEDLVPENKMPGTYYITVYTIALKVPL